MDDILTNQTYIHMAGFPRVKFVPFSKSDTGAEDKVWDYQKLLSARRWPSWAEHTVTAVLKPSTCEVEVARSRMRFPEAPNIDGTPD